MSKIILISGYKRAGKDHIAQMLEKEFKNSRLYSFASPLKEIVADTFGITLGQLDSFKNDFRTIYIRDEDKTFQEVTDFRKVLQIFGTEAIKKHTKGIFLS